MKLNRRTMLAAGAAGLALPAALPARAQDKTARIGIAIPAATHGWTGGLNFHTERTIKALEAAVQMKEKYGGTVTVITMGPPMAADTLRECLACGADASRGCARG